MNNITLSPGQTKVFDQIMAWHKDPRARTFALAVVQIDKKTGKEMAVFESTHAANRFLKIKNGVHAVCTGKRKSAGGYFWKFKE